MKAIIFKTVLIVAAVFALSVNVMASGSITNAVDSNKVSAETTTRAIVGVKLETVKPGMFSDEIQKEVDTLNQADAEATLQAAFEAVYGKDKVPQVDLYNADGLKQEDMDLKEFKFLSSVMNLTIDEVPTEEKQVEVTFTVNNLTDKIEPFILHRCEKHGWQLLETEEVSENQIKASFHSPGGPVAVVALSVNVMASGSITNAVDSNKVSAETTTRAIVGVKLETVKPGMFSDEIQKEVDTLNQADAEATLQAAFEAVYGKDKVPQVDLYNADGLKQEDMDLKEFKFLSSVMNLTIDEVPTEEKQVEVTFTVNNLTDKIEPFILHRCEKHGWQLLETEEVSENQIKASFHSPGGPVAVVYRELPEEQNETDSETAAP